MAIVLFLARCYRPLSNRSLAGSECCVCFITWRTNWKCPSKCFISRASSRSISVPYETCGNWGETQNHQQLCVNHSQRKESRLQMRRRSDAVSQHTRIRQLFRLSTQSKPMRVDSRHATCGAQPQSGLEKFSTPEDEFQGFCEGGQLDRALDVMLRREQAGIVSSASMYRSLLKACARKKALVQARHVHAHLARRGLETTRFLGEYLRQMPRGSRYVSANARAKCTANDLHLCQPHQGVCKHHRCRDGQAYSRRSCEIQESSQRDVVSWNVMIAAYTQQGEGLKALQLYNQMRTRGVSPDDRTFVSVFQAVGTLAEKEEGSFLLGAQVIKLKSLEIGKRVHVDACRNGHDSDVFVANTLISMYGKCGSISDAEDVFEGLFNRDVVSWNAMLSTYAQGQAEKAWGLYVRMQEEGVTPDDRTFVSMLQSCGILAEREEESLVEGPSLRVMALWKLRTLHSDIQRHEYGSSVYVDNILVSMYGKCGSLMDAHILFDGLSQRNLVSWNGLLAAYVHQSQEGFALQLYEQMQDEGVSADNWTFVSVLQACGALAEKEGPTIVDGQPTKLKYLELGKVMHFHARTKGCNSDVFVGSTLISLYSKCGSIWDAQNVFNDIDEQNVVSWNAIIAAYCQHGHGDIALQMYEMMLEIGLGTNDRTCVSVLQACSILADDEEPMTVDGNLTKITFLEKGKVLHADACSKGYASDVFVSNTLVSLYGKCGSLVDAHNVFQRLSERSVVAWTAMLVAYAQQGQAEKSLKLYEQMRSDGVSPDAWTFVAVLQGCGILAEREDNVVVASAAIKLTSLGQGKAIHADAMRMGYDSDVCVGNSLISMYGKCGSVLDAQYVFDALPQLTVAGWTAIIAAHAQQSKGEKVLQLYEQMSEGSISPNERTFVSLLQAIGSLAEQEDCIGDGSAVKMKLVEKVKVVHADAWRKGYGTEIFLGNTLVSLYGKCGSISDAHVMFDELSKSDVVSWNGMITAYVQQGQAMEALQLFEKMREEGISPNDRTLVSVFQACNIFADEEGELILDGRPMKLKCWQMGKAVHAEAQISNCFSDVFVCNSLICLYGRCGSILDAQKVFEGMLVRNVVSWNSLLAAYVQQDEGEQALKLYGQMQEEDVSPDERTFVSALQACGILAEKGVDTTDMKVDEVGKLIHADACKKGCNADVFVGNTLISMYGKCGNIVDAEDVFAGLSQPNLISWNAMLTAYVQQDQADKALQLYEQMQMKSISPDDRTFVSVLQAYGILAERDKDVDGKWTRFKCLLEGKAVHRDAWKKGYESDVFVCSSLISMYGKCGSLVDAQDVFDGLSQQSLVVWNALLSAYVEQGLGETALQLYRQMQQRDGIRPDGITLACVLQACSYTGSLDVCREIHSTVLSSGVEMSLLLGNTLIHAYGRCASVEDAQIVFDALVQPNVASWNALLAAYARKGDYPASLECFDKMQLADVKPDGVTFLSVLNACSHAGLVDKGIEVFESMSIIYGVTPEIGHYVSIIDLLGRAGYFSMVQHLLSTMPQKPDLATWLCVLGACRKHGKIVLGKQAFDCAVQLDPYHSAAYVLMVNIYADAGLWDCAEEVKALRHQIGARKKPGLSWTDYEKNVTTFVVGDQVHPLLYVLLQRISASL